MLFHVTMTRQGPESLDPATTARLLEEMVLPTFRKLEETRKSGKLQGGLITGKRALAFVMEAASIEELDAYIQGLPLWAMMDVDVSPLTPFESRAKADARLAEQMKALAR
ncbi:MAG: hypothetical protein HY319_13460 [Armatimonadetes bacterium]|nr:hypothetical protein [Armatimonadota bacterium]